MDNRQLAEVTAREIEVLELVAQRLSNAEIATELYISLRTVESHVSALLRKLGVSRRHDLARLAADQRRRRERALPRFATSFVGRAAQLDIVSAQFAVHRLVTLVGPPGVGKTRLAVEVATTASKSWFVDLAPAPPCVDAGHLLDVVARSLDLTIHPGEQLADALAASFSEPALIVLDNCEHVVEAAADLVNDILNVGVPTRVLATSREPLGVSGERVLELDPLDVPPERFDGAPTDLAQFDAVRLFVDRATASSSRFELTQANAGAVARLCRQLDGLPLAIELAASRVRAYSTSELVARLGHRFELLARKSQTDGRHGTLRAAIEWSYHLLDEDERDLFERLSVFPADFDLAAAEAVGRVSTEDHAVVTLLASLVDKSIVSVSGAEPQRRFRLLESLRAYAADRLSRRSDASVVRDRHRDWYVVLTEEAAPRLRGHDASEWLTRLDREHDNLEAALGWSLERNDSTPGLRMCIALWWLWYLRGRFEAGRRWLEQLLEIAPDAPAGVRADAWRLVGLLAFPTGNHDTAASAFDNALKLYRQVGDGLGVAKTFNGRGIVAWEYGAFGDASGSWLAALAEFRLLGDDIGIASALNNLGLLAREQGRCSEARVMLTDCLDRYRRADDAQGTASALANLAELNIDIDEFDRAGVQLDEALRLRRTIGDENGIATALALQASLVALRGHLADADDLLNRSLDIARAIGSRKRIAYAVAGQADLAARRGELDDALEQYDEASAMFSALHEPLGVVTVLAGRTAAAARGRAPGFATVSGRHALRLARRLGHPRWAATTELALATANQRAGKRRHAAGHLCRALSRFSCLGSQRGVAGCLEGTAELVAEDDGVTVQVLAAANGIRDRIGAPIAPVDRTRLQHLATVLRAALGDDEFAARWQRGYQLSVAESAQLASRLTTS
jgi:predicted ATPase/DNA-binding CsgD family transcriptional regulator